MGLTRIEPQEISLGFSQSSEQVEGQFIDNLERLAGEYLLTQNDDRGMAAEHFGTCKDHAKLELDGFIEYLKKRAKLTP